MINQGKGLVWVVLELGWDLTEVLGVFSTLERAREAAFEADGPTVIIETIIDVPNLTERRVT